MNGKIAVLAYQLDTAERFLHSNVEPEYRQHYLPLRPGMNLAGQRFKALIVLGEDDPSPLVAHMKDRLLGSRMTEDAGKLPNPLPGLLDSVRSLEVAYNGFEIYPKPPVFQKEDRYLVAKLSNVHEFLTDCEKDILARLLEKVEEGRRAVEARPPRQYVVISDKNPKAYREAWDIIEQTWKEDNKG
ncbi:hypothetical protein S0112_053 [Shewanella phage S0112]|nr:hypothetical protein S0112_053 [Shewanella phage S0112]